MELTSNSGNISSPAFGVVDYPSNQECSYKITRPGGGPLSLRFNRFDVAADDSIKVCIVVSLSASSDIREFHLISFYLHFNFYFLKIIYNFFCL